MRNVPPHAAERGEVAPDGDSRRASAHWPGAPAAARGRAKRCRRANRRQRHPHQTALRPPPARTHPPGSRPAPEACAVPAMRTAADVARSEEHTSELQSLMRTSSAVFCLKQKKKITFNKQIHSDIP